MNMRILIACEESQKVTSAFIARGFDATSIDIQPTRGDYPEKHIQGCALKEAYSGKYDMMIAFPPCTYLSKVGAPWLTRHGKCNLARYYKGLDARAFFMGLYNAPIKYKALENPTPLKAFKLPRHTQAVQPWQHGHPYTKRTLLWLHNLPPLKETSIVKAQKGWCDAKRNPKHRSETFTGIAEAMATQWSEYILSKRPQQLKLFAL